MKTFKVIDIILLSLLGACLLASCISYFVIPQETKDFFNFLITILNKPLPIAGVSIALIGYELGKLFLKTSLGKKQMEKLWDLNQNLKDNLEVQKAELVSQIETLKNELNKSKEIIEKQKEYIDKVATTIPNKKVNDLVEQYGKEETNS